MKPSCFLYCYFSRIPLNYDTLLRRFQKHRHIFPLTSDRLSLLLDSIHAARTLQLSNESTTFVSAESSLPLSASSLGLSPKSDSLLIENSLWSFLLKQHHQEFISCPQLIKAFFTVRPVPKLNERVFYVAECHCLERERERKPLDIALIYTALNMLLDQKDYASAFKLISISFASPYYLKLRALQLKRLLKRCALTILATSGLESFLFPMVPCTTWLVCNTIVMVTAAVGPVLVSTVCDLPRLGWRKHISLWRKVIHEQELLAVNKVICHFEEHNEINILNFHYSKARQPLNLNIFDRSDYILETPLDTHATNVQMQKLFKSELLLRKMRTKDLAQELIFLEFWQKHGEGFEWVEPDQDPAEMQKFRIK